MEVVLNGVKKFLEIINNNWTSIMVCIGLGIMVYRKAVNYFSKSNDEKIEIAKFQIKETILKLITDAEEDYAEWSKAGSIKRSQVIGQIFVEYPILSTVIDQDEIVKWIDNEIDNALVTLREVIEKNN